MLPEPRAYFRRRYGVSEAEAEQMTRMVERFTSKKHKNTGQTGERR